MPGVTLRLEPIDQSEAIPAPPPPNANAAADIGERRPTMSSIPLAVPVPVSERRRVPPHAFPIATAILMVALVGAGFYGFSTSNTLADTQTALGTANAAVATLDESLAAATSRGDRLQGALDAKTACVVAQQADQNAAEALDSAQIDLYNLDARGSLLSNARNARVDALENIGNNAATAYNALLKRKYSTAEKYVLKVNAEMKVADQLLDTITAEVAKLNAALQRVEIQRGVLAAQVARTQSVCGTAPTDPGS
jgi:hypothetical protein